MNKRTTRHTNDKPVNPDPPSVEVVIVHRRPLDHPWLVQAVASIQEQTYPKLSLMLVDNQDMGVVMGDAINQAVAASTADFILVVMEEDQLTFDTVQAMVDMFQSAQKYQPNIIHVTTYCTIIVDGQNGHAQAQLLMPGMWLRSHLVEHGFNAKLDTNVHRDIASQVQDLQRLSNKPMTMAFAHHYGYILRQHPFRGDGY